MLISSLEKMEEVVEKNKELSWDGWDVIHSYHSEKARTSVHGRLIKGKWCIARRFEITEQGWEIPNKLVG